MQTTRSILNANRRLNFEETTSNNGLSNGNFGHRTRTPTPVRVVTSELQQKLRFPKRPYDDIHVIEEEAIKQEIKPELIDVDSPDPKRIRGREDSGIGDDDSDDITVICDLSNTIFPNKRIYSYAGLYASNGADAFNGGFLMGKFLRDFATDQYDPARKPLGCTYDEATNEWFLCDSANDAIRILRKESTRGTAVTADLHYPSAIVVTEPGRYCAVLDHRGIHLYDYRREAMLTLVEHNIHRDGYFNCRGLALTSAGDLVTIKQSKTTPQILFYSTKKQNELIKSIPYQLPDTPRNLEFRPSFIDIAPCGSGKDKMVVTDLGIGSFALYSLNPKTRELKLEKQVECYGEGEDKFQFISGAKFDANCELFITDARGHSLKYLSKDGSFIQKCTFDEAFPYVSNFCVNSKNELLVCDRRDGRMKLFKLKAKDGLDIYLDSLVS